MYKLCFYVPNADAEAVKYAVFASGAGKIGNYDQCSWQTQGNGQFRPLDGSQATIGKLNQLEVIKELKIELVCHGDYIKAAVAALKQAHPYEEPAYEVYRLEDF